MNIFCHIWNLSSMLQFLLHCKKGMWQEKQKEWTHYRLLFLIHRGKNQWGNLVLCNLLLLEMTKTKYTSSFIYFFISWVQFELNLCILKINKFSWVLFLMTNLLYIFAQVTEKGSLYQRHSTSITNQHIRYNKTKFESFFY
jgi:hypothetical protein